MSITAPILNIHVIFRDFEILAIKFWMKYKFGQIIFILIFFKF